MVHAGHHGRDILAVCEREHGHLGTGQELLDDHPAAAVAELLFRHHGMHGGFGFGARGREDDALSERQPVRLDHDIAFGERVYVAHRRRLVVEIGVARRGDAVAGHEILCKCLAAFDDGGSLARTETRDTRVFEGVHRPEHQRIVGSDHTIIYLLTGAELDYRRDVLCADGHALGVSRHAAVPGQRVDPVRERTFLQALYDGVLAPARTYDGDVHMRLNDGKVSSP